MTSTLLLVQGISQNIALFCCALFAGATTYVVLVEQPTISSSDRELTGAYMLFAHPRSMIFQTSFALISALAGLATGIAAGKPWWITGGVVLGAIVIFQMAFVNPHARRILDGATARESDASMAALTRLQAVQSLAGMAALFMFMATG